MLQKENNIGNIFTDRSPCFVIAEVGQAHDGSLGTAHAYIDAIAKTGANAVKFQTHIAEAESTHDDKFRTNFSYQDKTRYEYWRRMEFTTDQWAGLAEHAKRVGLIFLSSPFSEQAVDLLEGVGCPAWKLGSGEISSIPLLRRILMTGKPVLLSSGLASWKELETAVDMIRRMGVPFGIFQCTTRYPCPPESWGLNVIAELRRRYGCPVGFSDHSGTIVSGIAAATLGVNMLEVHVTFSRACFGPDVSSSLTLEELSELVKGVRQIEAALASPLDKDLAAENLNELKVLFSKSIVASRNLPKGHIITLEDIAFKKPGTGIPAREYEAIIGQILKNEVSANSFIARTDLKN
jgi:N,N'-diacetyllegionaminate synthase